MKANALLVALIALAITTIGGYMLLAGDSAEDSRPIVTAHVQRRTLRESISTRSAMEFAVTDTLLGAAAGRVTGIAVAAGDIVAAGTTLLTVNGRPVVAADGAFPYWRGLQLDDEGIDVRQLEEMLARDGFDPGDIDETFTRATEDALEAWQAAHGFPADGVLQESDLLVAIWPSRAGAILVEVGQFVSPGFPLVQLTEAEFTLSLELAPTEVLRVQPGLVVLVEVTGNRSTGSGVLNEPKLVTAAGAFPGAEAQSKWIATVSLDGPIDAVDGASVKATIIIREVPDAVVVPLAAVILDEQGQSAVQVQDADGTVRVVPVVTGLSEGSLIEIVSGLAGSEVVILDTGS